MRREVHRRPDPVDVHVAHAGVDVVATRSHLVEAERLEAVGLRAPAGHRVHPDLGVALAPRTPTPGAPPASRRCAGPGPPARRAAGPRTCGRARPRGRRPRSRCSAPPAARARGGRDRRPAPIRSMPDGRIRRPRRGVRCRDHARRRRGWILGGATQQKEAAWSLWSLSRRSWSCCSASWWRACCAAMPTSCAPCTSSAWASGTRRRPASAPATRPLPCHAWRRRPPAPRCGPAPAVAGVTPTGDARAVAVDNSDDLTLLGFLSSGCTGCAAFWDALQAARTPRAARPHPRRDRHQGTRPRGPGRGAGADRPAGSRS